MCSLIKKFGSAKTRVYWDVADCPVPDDLSPDSIYRNIKTALRGLGYSGRLLIKAYSDTSINDFVSAKIELQRAGNYHLRRYMIFKDIYKFAIHHPEEPSNLMLISRDISVDQTCITILYFLAKRGHINIFLAQAEDSTFCRLERGEDYRLLVRRGTSVSMLVSLVSVAWSWNSLAYGRCPFNNQSVTPIPESVSRVRLNLHLPSHGASLSISGNAIQALTRAQAEICVFWDTGDFPIPDNLCPISIAQNIRTALADECYRGSLSSIWAFAELNHNLDTSRFLSAGIEVKLSRAGDLRMLPDILLWLVDNPRPSNLLIISKSSQYIKELRLLKKRHYNFLLAQEAECSLLFAQSQGSLLLGQPRGSLLSVQPQGSLLSVHESRILNFVTSVWLWPTLAEGGPAFY